MGNSDSDLFVRNQVFQLQFGCLVQNLGAALVSELFPRCLQLLDDHRAQFRFRGQNGCVLCNALAYVDQFLDDFVGGKLGEAIQLPFEDRVDLPIGQAGLALRTSDDSGVELDDNILGKRKATQVFSRFCARSGSTDNANDLLDVIQGNLQALENVFTLASLFEQERRAPANHL